MASVRLFNIYDSGEPKNDLKKKYNKIRKGFLSSTALAVLDYNTIYEFTY